MMSICIWDVTVLCRNAQLRTKYRPTDWLIPMSKVIKKLSSSANQEIPCILCNLQVHYDVHISQPNICPCSKPDETSPCSTILYLRSILILSSHQHQDPLSALGFDTFSLALSLSHTHTHTQQFRWSGFQPSMFWLITMRPHGCKLAAIAQITFSSVMLYPSLSEWSWLWDLRSSGMLRTVGW